MQSELLKKIENDAAKHKPCPKELDPPETMLYYMLMGVYSSYQAGKITREQGHQIKVSIYTTYQKLKAEYDQFTEICKIYQQRLLDGYSVGGVTIIPKEENHEGKF